MNVINNVPMIVGAIMYSYWSSRFGRMDYRLIVWDESGKLYYSDIYVMAWVKGSERYVLILVKGIEDNLITDSITSGMYDVFSKDNTIIPCLQIQYNEILTRIEDIYGMSIEEFSLGQLDYELPIIW